jgi:hypothetical protein
MRVRLITDHTHAGIFYPAGSVIDIPDADARWLIAMQCATEIQHDRPKKKATTRGDE